MAMIYRTDGAWGSGKGTNLAPAEVDGNFFELDGRVTEIEDNPIPAVTPISITISGGLFYMDLSDGTTIGPIVMTMPVPQWRGTWAAGIDYQEMDFFTAPDGGFGAVLRPHTSTAPFSWAALDEGGLPLYQEIVGGSGTTAALDDLVDVAVSASADGDLLVYNLAAAVWQNRSKSYVATTVLPPFGGDAGTGGTRGVVPAPAAGDAAAGKVLGAGGVWVVPPAGSGGGSGSLAGLSDVLIASPVDGHLLQYAAGDGKWHNRSIASLGAGTVTQVNSGAGLSGGPITATGTLSLAQIADSNLLANTSGAAAAPIATTISQLLDHAISLTRGAILYRSGTGWTSLAPGIGGQFLATGGPGVDVSWGTPAGAGTVTAVYTGSGLTGGPITASGTISLANIAAGQLLANLTGSAAAPSGAGLSTILDAVFGTTQGTLLYRSGTAWAALTPGVAGQVLTTGGASANPSWAAASGGTGGVFIGDAPPVGPSAGSLWWDSVTGQLFIYYSDANSSQWVAAAVSSMAAAKYNIAFSFVGGVLAASQLLGLHRVSRAITIPANFGSFSGHVSQAGATANATASTVLSVDRAVAASPNTFAQIGTITIAAGGITPTFATSGGASVSIAQGDVLRLTGPATADATLANVYVTLVAQEV